MKFKSCIGAFSEKAEQIIEPRIMIAIDLITLLEHINNHPPENITQLNSIILSQRQYNVIVEIEGRSDTDV